MLISTCRLCLQKKKLCKSHIYPEYMYANCYNDKHSFIEFNAGKNSFNKTRRKGTYEYLLCSRCESILQKYEDYAKSILYGEVKPYIKQNMKQYINRNYEYNKFKLFSLSLLWRASISSHEIFVNASLGKYEDELRKILLNGREIPVNEFPVYIIQMLIKNELANSVFMEICQSKVKMGGKTIYQLIVDGILFSIGTGSLSVRTFNTEPSVSRHHLRVDVDKLSEVSPFVDVYSKLKKQGKFSVYETGNK